MTTQTFDRQVAAVTGHRTGKSAAIMFDLAGDFVRDMCSFGETRGIKVDRNKLLEETARFLQRLFPISDHTAQITAGKAIGLYESWGSPVAFDMNHSTSHTVFLRDSRTGRTHVVTARELSQLLAEHDGRLA